MEEVVVVDALLVNIETVDMLVVDILVVCRDDV